MDKSSQIFLKVENGSVGYKTPLIDEINLEVPLGKVCLLIGDNGVGKTTLINTLLGQLPLLGGSIYLDNKNLTSYSPKELAKKIAIVFSKSTLPENYTVKDLISLGKFVHYPYYFRLSQEDKCDIDQIIDCLDLMQYRNTPISQLSDGNLQKAYIGRAIAQQSSLIILDEPTTHLDENNKIILLKLLFDLARKNQKLILFSSHDWRISKEIADEIWYIKSGKLYAGNTENILSNHQELIRKHIFELSEGFVPPEIFAPNFEKELLFSYLQKKFSTDLSSLSIHFSSDCWEIQFHNKTLVAKDFQQIKNTIVTLL